MDENVKILLGLKIRKIRKLAGLTQEGFAQLLNLETKTISNLECGKNFPSFETICNIVKVFNVEPNHLLDFMDYNESKSDVQDLLILELLKTKNSDVKSRFIEFFTLL